MIQPGRNYPEGIAVGCSDVNGGRVDQANLRIAQFWQTNREFGDFVGERLQAVSFASQFCNELGISIFVQEPYHKGERMIDVLTLLFPLSCIPTRLCLGLGFVIIWRYGHVQNEFGTGDISHFPSAGFAMEKPEKGDQIVKKSRVLVICSNTNVCCFTGVARTFSPPSLLPYKCGAIMPQPEGVNAVVVEDRLAVLPDDHNHLMVQVPNCQSASVRLNSSCKTANSIVCKNYIEDLLSTKDITLYFVYV